jgi:hypothetical protein
MDGSANAQARFLIKLIGATYSRADYRDGVKLISKMMSRAGITSAHDASGVHEYLRG